MTQQPQSDETDSLRTALVDNLARQIKREAQDALHGRAQRFQQVAAEFAHLGNVADELLSLALQDVERTPEYFAALTRKGLTETFQGDREVKRLNVIQVIVRKKAHNPAGSDERR